MLCVCFSFADTVYVNLPGSLDRVSWNDDLIGAAQTALLNSEQADTCVTSANLEAILKVRSILFAEGLAVFSFIYALFMPKLLHNRPYVQERLESTRKLLIYSGLGVNGVK